MTADEGTRAKHLIPHLRGVGYLLGDSAYDEVYDLAWKHGHQLVAPRVDLVSAPITTGNGTGASQAQSATAKEH